MATHRADVVRTPSRRRSIGVRRVGLALAGTLAVLVAPFPAQASPEDPASSAEAAALVAARGHDLEVLTEEFNDARERVNAAHAEAEAAIAAHEQATARLAAAQEHVRGIARSAFTTDGLSSFRALMTSESADDFVSRVATLESIAGHHGEILATAAEAGAAASRARATAEEAAAEAQAQFDAVSAQQAALEAEIAEYQAVYDQLSAAEQRSVVDAGHADRASRDDRSAPAASGPIVAGSEAAQIAVDTAMAQRGKPYVWAAAGPDSFDCSGLVQYAYRAAGIELPHSSRMQSGMGAAVSRDALQPGDLVFFYSPVSHVGIYIGNGQMVHAPTSGDVVRVADVGSMGSYAGARRIAG